MGPGDKSAARLGGPDTFRYSRQPLGPGIRSHGNLNAFGAKNSARGPLPHLSPDFESRYWSRTLRPRLQDMRANIGLRHYV